MKTVQETLKKSATAKAYVFFTPYRPWLYEKDLAFFDLAREVGFAVNKIFEHVMEKVMFEEDPGVRKFASFSYSCSDKSLQDELLRRTVFGYELTWAEL